MRHFSFYFSLRIQQSSQDNHSISNFFNTPISTQQKIVVGLLLGSTFPVDIPAAVLSTSHSNTKRFLPDFQCRSCTLILLRQN